MNIIIRQVNSVRYVQGIKCIINKLKTVNVIKINIGMVNFVSNVICLSILIIKQWNVSGVIMERYLIFKLINVLKLNE